MKKGITLAVLSGLTVCGFAVAEKPSPESVKVLTQKVADWQIFHFNDFFSNWKEAHHPLHWTNGALYVGMNKWAAMAGDDKYYNWMKGIGELHKWELYDLLGR